MIDSRAPKTTIFPSWVEEFGDDRGIANRLTHISVLWERRAKGNLRLPHIHLSVGYRNDYKRYIGMRRTEAGRHDLPLEKAVVAHKVCIEAFTPVAHRTFWARWLYLERALKLASQTGDLLLGAIVLRTMAEDVWALVELSRFENQLRLNINVPTYKDLAHIRRHGDLLWSRFLPPIEELPELPESNTPQPFEGSGYEKLHETFQRLNDYVHPNYGSLLLSLFPERAHAVQVLLDSYITIYEAFFEVPWVERPVEGPFTELPPIVVRTWQEEVAFLQSVILPEIQQHRGQRGLASEDEDPAPSLKQWFERLSELTDFEFAWKRKPNWFAPLRPLGEFILGRSDSDQKLWASLKTRADLGIPMRFYEVALLAGGRRLALDLERLFPTGRPSPERDPLQWFRFCQKGIKLALTETHYKITIMMWASMRQLNDRNPIGSILATRSLIEHYAVALYLGERLKRAWEEITKRGSAGTLPVDRLVRLEEDIARFLAGTKGTEEELTIWKKEWARLGLDKAVNLRSATERGLKQDVRGYLYNFGSDVIHGRKARGVELCPPTDTIYLKANLSRGLLALELSSTTDSILDTVAKTTSILKKMESLHKALSKPGADWRKIIRITLSTTDRLKAGVHYTGKGTMRDPFTFAEGIEYYDAFYRLCRQLRLDAALRRLVGGPNGRFLDAVPDRKGKHCYFAPATADWLSESAEDK